MTDLPPDVRDRAIFEAREVLFSWIEGRSIDPELAPAIVVAVVAVVAPEIERPLQARIAELEAALAFMLKRFDPGGDMATLRTMLAGAVKPDDQLVALEAEFPEKAPMLRQAMKDAPAAILRLHARAGEMAEELELLRAERDPFPPGTRVAFIGPATSNWKNRVGTVLGPTDHRHVRFDDIGTYNEVSTDHLRALAAGVTESEIEIDSGDLRVNHYDPPDATELSGAMRGVTITHIPTGIAFSHHSERSQLQNKARCYEDLKRRLAELAPSERAGVTESETP